MSLYTEIEVEKRRLADELIRCNEEQMILSAAGKLRGKIQVSKKLQTM